MRLPSTNKMWVLDLKKKRRQEWVWILDISFLKIFFFLTWTIFNPLLNLLHYCFYFMFCFVYGHKACGILAFQPGIEPPAVEGEVFTSGPQWKSLDISRLLLSFQTTITNTSLIYPSFFFWIIYTVPVVLFLHLLRHKTAIKSGQKSLKLLGS